MSHFDVLKGARLVCSIRVLTWSMIAVVGKGGFGKVNAVESRLDKKLYAMKTLKKSMLLRKLACAVL